MHHVVLGGENIARVVKDGKAHVVSEVGEMNRGHTKFEVVEKKSAAAQRKTSGRVAGTRLI